MTIPDQIIAAARGWIGTPYLHQASTKGAGADCLGLVRGVWREVIGPEPYEVPNYSRSWGDVAGREYIVEVGREVMTEISPRALVPGAMLVFRMLRGATAKHCGILTAAGTFIHAYERTAVSEERLTEAWRRKIAYAFLFPGAS